MASTTLTSEVSIQIANSILIDCCVVFIQRNGPDERILGSGTLVSTDNTIAILTADHVLDELSSPTEHVQLFFPTRFDNSPRSPTLIQMKYLERRTVGRGAKECEGPDLGLLVVPDAIKSRFFPSTKTFYNLTKRRQRVLGNPCPVETGVWVVVGTPEEWTAPGEPQAGFDPVKEQRVLIGSGIVNNEYERDGFDYMDFSLKFDACYEGPTRFGGCSGGGLWHIRLQKNESGRIVIDPILSGVVFYQSDPQRTNPIIRCNGRKSIYQNAHGTMTLGVKG